MDSVSEAVRILEAQQQKHEDGSLLNGHRSRAVTAPRTKRTYEIQNYLSKPTLPCKQHFKYFYKVRTKYQTVSLWETVSDSIRKMYVNCISFTSLY